MKPVHGTSGDLLVLEYDLRIVTEVVDDSEMLFIEVLHFFSFLIGLVGLFKEVDLFEYPVDNFYAEAFFGWTF